MRKVAVAVLILVTVAMSFAGATGQETSALPDDLLALFPKEVDFYIGIPDLQKAYPALRALMVKNLGEKGEERWSQLENVVTGAAFPFIFRSTGIEMKKALREVEGIHIVMVDSTMGFSPNSRDYHPPKLAIVVTAKDDKYLKEILKNNLAKLLTASEDYKGHSLHQFRKEGLSLAVVGRHGVFGTTTTIKEMIDRAIGENKTPSLRENPSIAGSGAEKGTVPLLVSTCHWREMWRKFKRSQQYGRRDFEEVGAIAGLDDILSTWSANTIGPDGGTSRTVIDMSPEMDLYRMIRQRGSAKKEMLSIVPADAVAAAVIAIDDPKQSWSLVQQWLRENRENFDVDDDWNTEMKGHMGFGCDDLADLMGREAGCFWVIPDDGFQSMNDGPSGMVFALECKSPQAAKEFLTKFKRGIGWRRGTTKEEVYKGTTICLRDDGFAVSVAANEQYFLLAAEGGKGKNSPSLKKTIDTFKGDAPSMAGDAKFTPLLARIPAVNSRTILVNWHVLAKHLEGVIPFAFTRYLPEWREATAFVDGENAMTISSASDGPSLMGIMLALLPELPTGTPRSYRMPASSDVVLFPDRKDAAAPAVFASAEEREKRIGELIARLGDDDWNAREQATEELERIGEAAAPRLTKALGESKDPEVTSRIKKVLMALGIYEHAPDVVKTSIDAIVAFLSDESVRADEEQGSLHIRYWRRDAPGGGPPDFDILRSEAGVKALWEATGKRGDDRFKAKAIALLAQCNTRPIEQEMLKEMEKLNADEDSKESDTIGPAGTTRTLHAPVMIKRHLLIALTTARSPEVRTKVVKSLLSLLNGSSSWNRFDAQLVIEHLVENTHGYNPYHGEKRRLKAIEAIEASIGKKE